MRRVAWIAAGVLLVAATVAYRYRHHFGSKPLETGQCTWYVVERARESGWEIEFDQPFGRHALNWPQRLVGVDLVTNPVPGSIMVLDAWPGNPYGHVAYIESVIDKDHWTISHANMPVGKQDRIVAGCAIYRAEAVRKGEAVKLDGRDSELRLIGFLVMRR